MDQLRAQMQVLCKIVLSLSIFVTKEVFLQHAATNKGPKNTI